jgi:hypothetical protein
VCTAPVCLSTCLPVFSLSLLFRSSARPLARLRHLYFCFFLPVSSFEVGGGQKKAVILINLLHSAADNKSKAKYCGEVMQGLQTLSPEAVQGLQNNGVH